MEHVATANPVTQNSQTRAGPGRKWAQRIGVLTCAFFLIKGLAWLALPAMMAAWASR